MMSALSFSLLVRDRPFVRGISPSLRSDRSMALTQMPAPLCQPVPYGRP